MMTTTSEVIRAGTILGDAVQSVLTHGTLAYTASGAWVNDDGQIVLRGLHAIALHEQWPNQHKVGRAAVKSRFTVAAE